MKSTTALRKISGLKKKIRALQGGQGAGKTIAVLILIINHLSSNPNKKSLIASEELTKMRDTVIQDTIRILQSFNLKCLITGADSGRPKVEFPNGSYIRFLGLDKEDIGKGFHDWDILYLNEADKIKSFETARQLISRFRKVFLDWNPVAKFWAHQEIIPREDCELLILTFLDNEFLDRSEVDEILLYFEKGYGIKWAPDLKREDYPEPISKYWANKWRVYGLGEIGILEGAVFEDWSIIDEIPKEAVLIGGGIDFGFVNPASAILCYKMNEEYYFDELIYETKLTNQDMADMIILNGFEDILWYADNAEPKSIQEMRRLGVNIHPCDGKTDLINYAVKILNNKHFYYTKRSINMIAEAQGYVWDKDSKGDPTGKPKKKNDHAMNAKCYFVATEGKYDGIYR